MKTNSLAFLLAAALLASANLCAEPLTFYLATNGNDQWSGRSANPSANRTDGPFATLPAALSAARLARQNKSGTAEGITILLRDGLYELAEPVVLTPEDSGANASQPLTISAYPGERPILSGGRRITGWAPAHRRGVWLAVVPDVREGKGYFRSLFVNGHRATSARTPNEGAFFLMQGARLSDRPAQFKFKPGDVKPDWANDPDAELIAFEKWIDFRQHIKAVDLMSNMVTLSSSAPAHTHEEGARYFIENTADSLDAPGEWYLDRKTGIVKYWARPGENLAEDEVTAGRLPDLLLLKGDFTEKKAVQHVVLRGLTFSYTDWSMATEGYTDSQAAVRVAGNIAAEGANDCVIEDCTFAHLAGYAVDLGRGCQRFKIVGNEMFDLGAGGVRLGETAKRTDPFEQTHEHVVTDNHIHHAGLVYAPAVGVLILQSGQNRIAHNEIDHLYYTAVSVGWNWGYQETPCRENIIEFNHLHDIGQFMLSDMGAVYTLGIQRGTAIRNNLIHDINSFTYGGWGLYPDEGSTDIVWENNVVYRCKSAGFHQHYGRDNIVRNNIFAFGKEHQLMRSREEAHTSFIFTNNIVCFDSGALLGSTWKNEHFLMDRNLYFDARPGASADAMKLAGANWEQWRQRGHDQHSLIADPLFVAPEKYDFQLKANSPAFKLGFKPIDLSQVGVRSKAPRGAAD